ncbi:hypothetical protein P7K49_036978 [Saguinus oedipus]|uniref:Zinc finger protein ZFPM1 n=1 Tax=Saguinus oedipus TaxID=9490 RepID=A0ABQ9TLR3_SAGOE|nr:hypothetical protein P7K49_036978 [Saguinus oedipus]
MSTSLQRQRPGITSVSKWNGLKSQIRNPRVPQGGQGQSEQALPSLSSAKSPLGVSVVDSANLTSQAETDKEPPRCEGAWGFLTSALLGSHPRSLELVSSHEDVFPCKDCGIWYRSERNLQAHWLYYCASRQGASSPATAASEEKPKEAYPNERVCPFPQCHKSCPSASSLEIHMRSHSGEPPPQMRVLGVPAASPPSPTGDGGHPQQ